MNRLLSLCLLFRTALPRPSESERVELWYQSGNTWPPRWQEESEEFQAAMAFREEELMQIPGLDERWENFMQFTASRMVPHFTEFGFKVIQTPVEMQKKLLAKVREGVSNWDSLPYEHDVDAIYHPEGMQPKFVNMGQVAREVFIYISSRWSP